MIKLNKDYSDYTDETDDAYPAGKAVDATTEESIDGTPYLKKWMNNIHGAFTALWVKAFGSVEGMSGDPDSVDDSDILLAVEKLIERPLSLHSDTRGVNAHGATSAATEGQIVTRDQVGRAKVAAPVEGDDIARKEEVDTEATARASADNGLQNQIDGLINDNAPSLNNTLSSDKSLKTFSHQGIVSLAQLNKASIPSGLYDITIVNDEGLSVGLPNNWYYVEHIRHVYYNSDYYYAEQTLRPFLSNSDTYYRNFNHDTSLNFAYQPYVSLVGVVVASPMASLPDFLPCNGAAVSRTTYVRLFQAIGGTYGWGDGHSTFHLPPFNAHGAFLRGKVGNAAGGFERQEDAIRNITGSLHGRRIPPGYHGSGALYRYETSYAEHSVDGNSNYLTNQIGFDASRSVGANHVANENRPVNHAIYWHIKY